MERQRREQRSAIDEEGPSPEGISGELTMGRQRREQRTKDKQRVDKTLRRKLMTEKHYPI